MSPSCESGLLTSAPSGPLLCRVNILYTLGNWERGQRSGGDKEKEGKEDLGSQRGEDRKFSDLVTSLPWRQYAGYLKQKIECYGGWVGVPSYRMVHRNIMN